jgi:hypothetical protein
MLNRSDPISFSPYLSCARKRVKRLFQPDQTM